MIIALTACTAGKITPVVSAGSEQIHGIIPAPRVYSPGRGYYVLSKECRIIVEGRNAAETEEIAGTGRYLSEILRRSTGYPVEVIRKGKRRKGDIVLVSDDTDISLGKEGYSLHVVDEGIMMISYTPEGLFRGAQTIRQMFPPEIEKREITRNIEWKIPAAEIKDQPVYEWRGTMLDVARHFFTVDTVKKCIDNAAYYKMNRFHLHLTDDQGWRLEIKSWPDLTRIGGSTRIDGGKGGFFTQKEYSEIIRYAAKRYITVIPEIDMPAHVNAALASYGELNPDGQRKVHLAPGTSTLMCRSEVTWRFVSDVIQEVSAITPGEYIHIGGDEADETPDDDYRYFIGRAGSIVKSNGKTMVGWNPVQKGENTGSETIVQYWRNVDGDIGTAVRKGMRIIMSPAEKCYLDMKYSPDTVIGFKWAGYISVLTAYSWDPGDYTRFENIIGVECPLWTETIATPDDIDYMMYPRLPGYAEIGWSEQSTRSWEDYRARLRYHLERMAAMGIKFARE